MAQVRCSDGSLLTVAPVPVLDRNGVAYEWTLVLLLDGEPFGEVGERCGWFLSLAVARLRAAEWPASTLEEGVQGWALDQDLDPQAAWEDVSRYLPRDRELFAFRSRDPDDLSMPGELRAWLRSERHFEPGVDGARGEWRLQRRVVLDAWGDAGTGMRAVLTANEALALLEAVLLEASPAQETA